jgi:hypothetical protein
MLPPNGQDSLDIREAYLRQQRAARRVAGRGWLALWVSIGAVTLWLFIAAFAGFGH